MNWLVGAEVGDVFRWLRDGTMCRITEFRDDEVRFVYVNGRLTGRWGYTLLPQDVQLASAVERLADLERP